MKEQGPQGGPTANREKPDPGPKGSYEGTGRKRKMGAKGSPAFATSGLNPGPNPGAPGLWRGERAGTRACRWSVFPEFPEFLTRKF